MKVVVAIGQRQGKLVPSFLVLLHYYISCSRIANVASWHILFKADSSSIASFTSASSSMLYDFASLSLQILLRRDKIIAFPLEGLATVGVPVQGS